MSELTARSEEGYGRLVSEIYHPVELVKTSDEVIASFVSRGSGWFKRTRSKVRHRLPIVGRFTSPAGSDQRDEFELIMPISGSFTYVVHGRRAELRPGYMMLLNPAEPYEFCRHASSDVECHHIPGAVLRQILPGFTQLCAKPFDAERGLGSAIRSLFATAWREMHCLNEAERFLLLRSIVTLLPAACVGADAPRAPTLNPKSCFARAHAFMARFASDPALRPLQVAEGIGISLSHLHSTMRKHGTTVGRTLLAIRLDRAKSLLGAEAGEVRIGEIAFAAGFSGPAHFSRCFRARFGFPASEYRRRQSKSAQLARPVRIIKGASR